MATYIANFMPPANGYGTEIGDPAAPCSGQCAQDVAAYIKAGLTIPTPQVCASDTGALCDGFEGASLDALKWSTTGSVSISREQKYAGNQSVKIVGAGGGTTLNGINIDLTNLTSLRKNQYGRVMMRVTSANALGGDFTLIEATGPANYTIPSSVSPMPAAKVDVAYSARIQGTDDKFMANYTTFPKADWTTDCTNHGQVSAALPKDTWACFEWHVDTTANEVTYWLNGQLLDISVKNKAGANCADHRQNDLWTGPAKLDKLHLGIDQYQNTAKPRTLYLDDVVVDTQRVGCPAAP